LHNNEARHPRWCRAGAFLRHDGASRPPIGYMPAEKLLARRLHYLLYE
jgi:hypothetical protein